LVILVRYMGHEIFERFLYNVPRKLDK